MDHLIGTSALFNGVAIPGRSLDKALGRYAFNIFIGDDNPKYPITLRGTGTGLRFRGRYLLLCTQHQLVGVDRQRVGMLTEDGGQFVTSGGMRHFSPSGDTDAYDLIAFDFTEPADAYPEFRSRFHNFAPKRMPPDPLGFLVTGCPFNDQLYDVAENNHIGLARRQVVCALDDDEPSDTSLFRVLPDRPLNFNPDGMSGGSAFALVAGDEGLEVGFAGIVARGGSHAFHVIKVGVVASFLESIADWGQRQTASEGGIQPSG
ncbi:hypothetical protein LJR016_004342 [Devosia sp. LjRoot16]|uniref:hypothetical protein n=1 Tax=Devosia sp. LjRoot16 TaxID=3342271 RepID=UPI003ECE66D1